MLTTLLISAQVPHKCFKRLGSVLHGKLAIYKQCGARQFTWIPIREFNNDLNELLCGSHGFGIIWIICRWLTRDLQRWREKDRVRWLDIHTKSFIERGDHSLCSINIQSKRMVPRRVKCGSISKVVNMTERGKKQVEIRERFNSRKREERSAGLLRKSFESVAAGSHRIFRRIYQPDEDAYFRIDGALEQWSDTGFNIGILHVRRDKQYCTLHARLRGWRCHRVQCNGKRLQVGGGTTKIRLEGTQAHEPVFCIC